MRLSLLALLPFTASSLIVRSSARTNPCSFEPPDDVTNKVSSSAPVPLRTPREPSAAASWQRLLNHYLQPSPRRHTFITPTTQPTTTTTPPPTSTSNPSHSFAHFTHESSVQSKNCPCKYSLSPDVDERISMDKGPYFYLFVNGLPLNEQRHKRACGRCSEDKRIASSKQRETVGRVFIPVVYGTDFRSNGLSHNQHPPVGASYLEPNASSPSLRKPIDPPARQLTSQFPVIRDWVAEHIRPILRYDIRHTRLNGNRE